MEHRSDDGMQLYVLKCSGDKYYVGCTNNLLRRLNEHFSGNGSEWTKLHKPVKLVYIKDTVSGLEEDMLTKEYMIKYGISQVRGARYCQLELPVSTVLGLEQDIWSAQGVCLRCGRNTHYVIDCSALTTIDGRSLSSTQNRVIVSPFALQSTTQPTSAHTHITAINPTRLVTSRTSTFAYTQAESAHSPKPSPPERSTDRPPPAVRKYNPATRRDVKYADTSAAIDTTTEALTDGATNITISARFARHAKLHNSITLCERCDRKGHSSASCYAKTDRLGRPLSN